jgi:hypothetical protein
MEMEHWKDLPVATVLAAATVYSMHLQIDPTIVMVGMIGLVFVTLSKILRNGK